MAHAVRQSDQIDLPEDTIFAVSSGAPPAAIAIVRISGPAALATVMAMAGPLPSPRHATLRALRDPHDAALLDRALVLVFPGPATATGEDLVELHLHGGRAVVAAVTDALAARPGLRHAEPGEFTRRALDNGVIDLTAAEGLADLLSAETQTQRRAALQMAEGGLRGKIEAWTTRLVQIAAGVEAQIDFSDEDDVAEETVQAIAAKIAVIGGEIERLLANPPVERLKDGLRIVIAGPPNSGKSTLLNALAERDVAIVSPISGTTRDRIEATVERGGVAYLLTDTAGLTDTPGDEVERIGVVRAYQAAAAADLVLWLGDEAPTDGEAALLWVHARADLPFRAGLPPRRDIAVSAVSGSGVESLWKLIAERMAAALPMPDAIALNRRQRDLLRQCASALRDARNDDMMIVAEELRIALRALDAVTGRAGVEQVLDSIFANFCIGK